MEWADHLREIRTDPEADGPRLVCADWLLDRADVRGEYIVVACQLARLAPGTPEYTTLDLRRRKLDVQHQRRWLKRITTLGAQGLRVGDSPRFTRGFVESITLIGQHVTSFEAVCDQEPITDVTFVNCGPRDYERLAAIPALNLVRDLTLRGELPLRCEVLLASPYLSSVRRISLPDGPNMLAALAAGTARPEHFQLAADVPSLFRLVDAGFFDRITRLDVKWLTDDGAVALSRAAMPALRALELQKVLLTERGMAALRAHLAQLEHLHYSGIAPSRATVSVLIDALSSDRLRSLVFDDFTCDALAELFESPSFASVESLQLLSGVCTPRIAEALRTTRYRDNLRSLVIDDDDDDEPT
jgi:uncharacterized protein (TIGR02996 family)